MKKIIAIVGMMLVVSTAQAVHKDWWDEIRFTEDTDLRVVFMETIFRAAADNNERLTSEWYDAADRICKKYVPIVEGKISSYRELRGKWQQCTTVAQKQRFVETETELFDKARLNIDNVEKATRAFTDKAEEAYISAIKARAYSDMLYEFVDALGLK